MAEYMHMAEHSGCFSPYMMISSTLQAVFGFDRRNEQRRSADINEQFQRELRTAHNEFNDEMEAQKIAVIRAKMLVSRKYRAEEKLSQNKLEEMTVELRKYFNEYLPIKQKVIGNLYDITKQYMDSGYGRNCKLNVILLHSCSNSIRYKDIDDGLENLEHVIGDIKIRRWCEKDTAHNSAILNLHAIMGNIPTLVISPSYNHGQERMYFSVSLWEAQSDTRPLIRPLKSISCTEEQLQSTEGKRLLQEEILFVSTIITGCARDSYMLLTQGLAPTLPVLLAKSPEIVKKLNAPHYHWVKEFVTDEYKSMASNLKNSACASGLLSNEQMTLLSQFAESASKKLSSILNNK